MAYSAGISYLRVSNTQNEFSSVLDEHEVQNEQVDAKPNIVRTVFVKALDFCCFKPAKNLFLSKVLRLDLEEEYLTKLMSKLSLKTDCYASDQKHVNLQLVKAKKRSLNSEIPSDFFINFPSVLREIIIDYVSASPLIIECMQKEIDIPQHLKRITALTLSKNTLTKKELTDLLKSCNRLQSLRITDYINSNWVKIITEECPKLVYLDLSYNLGITDECLDLVTETLTNLQHLSLKNSDKITDKTLFKIADRLKGLKHLDLTGCKKVSIAGIQRIVEELKDLQYLAIPVNQYTTDDLLEKIAQLPNLCHLGLHASRDVVTTITNVGIEKIIEKLPNLTGLSFWYIGCINSLTLIKIAMTLLRLQHLEIEGCHKIGMVGFYEMAIRLQHLQYLEISDCQRIPNKGYIHIADGFRSLRHLRLSTQNENFDSVLGYIAKAHPNLDYLELPYCKNLTDNGINHITQECKTLRYLSLYLCWQISDEGVDLIEDRLHFLEQLNIEKTSVSRKKIVKIRKKIANVLSDH